MKPIAIHLDRLSQALAAKGVELKRTDLLQVAAAAFGYHNQNEASAASQRGDLTPSQALPVCRVSIPSTPFERELVVLQTGDDRVYGIDAAFFDEVKDRRAERYGPTPFGTMADLSYATAAMDDAGGRRATSEAHLDRALREARMLRGQLDGITGETDQQAQDLGQAENTLSRLISALEGGETPQTERNLAADGTRRFTDAERASWARDIDGMAAAVEALSSRRDDLATVTPDTRQWSDDCVTALKAGLRIAQDWKGRYEQEVRFGPDWRAWTRDLKKAATRGATPLSDMDLHKIRHAVADNHCKSSESERSTVRWRVGQLMERHARALLLRLDIAEAQLAGELPPVRGSAHVAKGSLWRVDVGIAAHQGSRYATAFFRLAKDEDAETVGARIADDIADGLPVEFRKIRRAPREEAGYRLLDAARQALACLVDDSPARRTLLGAIAGADRIMQPIVGNVAPEPAPQVPDRVPGEAVPEGDGQSWQWNISRARLLQRAVVDAAGGYAIDRSTAIAALGRLFGFDHLRSSQILDGKDDGVMSAEYEPGGEETQ